RRSQVDDRADAEFAEEELTIALGERVEGVRPVDESARRDHTAGHRQAAKVAHVEGSLEPDFPVARLVGSVARLVGPVWRGMRPPRPLPVLGPAVRGSAIEHAYSVVIEWSDGPDQA